MKATANARLTTSTARGGGPLATREVRISSALPPRAYNHGQPQQQRSRFSLPAYCPRPAGDFPLAARLALPLRMPLRARVPGFQKPGLGAPPLLRLSSGPVLRKIKRRQTPAAHTSHRSAARPRRCERRAPGRPAGSTWDAGPASYASKSPTMPTTTAAVTATATSRSRTCDRERRRGRRESGSRVWASVSPRERT